MLIPGRQISKWWLLLIPPLLLIVSPVLLMFLFIGSNLARGAIGPPAIWNPPWQTPTHLDLVGKYSESERHLDSDTVSRTASLELNADGSMIVADLPVPAEFGKASCVLSGAGRWSGPHGDEMVDLDFVSDRSSGSCESSSYSFLEVTGRSKPYGLYWIVGDPDSGTGIWLKRKE
jgi:hypothetical protein